MIQVWLQVTTLVLLNVQINKHVYSYNQITV